MRLFLIGLVTLCLSVSSALAHPTHKHPTHTKEHVTPHETESAKDCLTLALLNEAVGVKSHDARITLGKLIVSRARVKGFPSTVCAVYRQRNVHRGRVHCEFSDSCIKHNKAPFRAIDVARAKEDAEVAMAMTDKEGPTDYLYFNTGSTCPVAAVKKVRKGPFIFCVPRHH